jgi:hypothetical protein
MLALPSRSAAPSAGPVIPSADFAALLARREAAVAQLRTIAGAVSAYREIGDAIWPPPKADDEPKHTGRSSARYAFDEPTNQHARGRGHGIGDDRWLEESIAAVDASLWDHLLDVSGLRTFLDHKAREEWREQIEKRKTPALTADNVRATFEALHARRGEFFERGVISVFRSLSWDYRTNRPHAFGRRIIVRGVHGAYGFPESRACDSLDDLARVLHVLDGQPEPDHREGVYRRLCRRNKSDASTPLADAYTSIRTFRNGNAHVTFLRAGLVDELNRILARHYPDALPPSRE